MIRLTEVLVQRIQTSVRRSVLNLTGPTFQYRSVFHGPPLFLLRRVYERLAEEGGIESQLPNGQLVSVPVVLLVGKLPDGQTNPDISACGICDDTHVMNLRNDPSCPRFVVLLPPGRHINQSLASASDAFGLSAYSNSGNSSIEDWWRDEFVQGLVEAALSRTEWPSKEDMDQARKLVHYAVRAADEMDRHHVSREHAWLVLSRLFSINETHDCGFADMISLACGFPPTQDGTIQADEQFEVLKKLAALFEEDGFRKGGAAIQEGTTGEVRDCLNNCLGHLQEACEVATKFGRAASAFYAPSRGESLDAPPKWWRSLTVEQWIELLQEERQPTGSLHLECTNTIIPMRRGVVAVVLDEVHISASCPHETVGIIDVAFTREVGGAANRRQWTGCVSIDQQFELKDFALPTHSRPVRYSVEAPNLKKAAIKVISLRSWDSGAYVFCRTASRISPPKRVKANRENVAYECSLSLSGQGRHYIDVYVRPGIVLDAEAKCYEADGSFSGKVSMVVRVSDHAFGFEVEVMGDCHYDILIFGVGNDAEKIRLHFSCEEAAAEGCRTEFERLIRLNRQHDQGRATPSVHLDRQARSVDLQTWLLGKNAVEHSWYPLVLSTDYAQAWRMPIWGKREGTVLSRACYLHDPRPSPEEMVAPTEFVKARRELASRIRGEDESELLESARLGDWLASDPTFGELLEQYLKAYLAWLEVDPTIAPWVDITVFCALESDGRTLVQEPDAVLISPLHPLRLAWHALAQQALLRSYRRGLPCPAASILDPDGVPDTLVLPLRTAVGGIQHLRFFSLECSSDYWSILWNATRLDRLASWADQAPFDSGFGVRIGGISSGFSVSQVQRALDDVAEMFSAKPVLNILVSSAAGQTSACNEGLLIWSKDRFGVHKSMRAASMGPRLIQIFDERKESSRPDDAEISNLAEDTNNSVRWFWGNASTSKVDLGIIAQLETSNAGVDRMEAGSQVGMGGLFRYRIRRQLETAFGAFLVESRIGEPQVPSDDGIADKLVSALVRLENLGDRRDGYRFAPSVSIIKEVLSKADFAAVSSSMVDPACFLGAWLPQSYLWDYDLPSYSRRSGDTNGYYLVSTMKSVDYETIKGVLSLLPGCEGLDDAKAQQIILEVARRGIPTVRGLSGGDAGAAGDLGLFVASRLLQDEFQQEGGDAGLLPVLKEEADHKQIALVVPVDPFRGYLSDLQRSLFRTEAGLHRPDLLVAGIRICDSTVSCKLTPVEVKFRTGRDPMSHQACKDALAQAKSLTSLFHKLMKRSSDPELLMWRITFQHLLLSMLGFGFRVYSQHRFALRQSREWSLLHARFARAVLADELRLECDARGRLIIIDGSRVSDSKDIDEDGFQETILLCLEDASGIIRDGARTIISSIRTRVGVWDLLPSLDEVRSDGVAAAHPGFERQVKEASSRTESNAIPPSRPVNDDRTVEQVVPVESQAATAAPISSTAPSSMLEPAAFVETSRGIEIGIGHTVDGFRSEFRTLNLSDTNLNQLNIGVVGDLGTGKTQLLKSLVYQISQSAVKNQGVKPRFLIFDYKRDYSAPEFVEAVGAEVVRPWHLPLNMFDISNRGDTLTPWLDRFKFFRDVLDKIYSGIGPVQASQLKTAVRDAYTECDGTDRQPTIYDIHLKYRALLGNKLDSPLSIIDDLVDMEMFTPDPRKARGFEHFLSGVVVVALDTLGQDDRTKNMLVAIMLNMFYEHMLRLPKRPYIGTDPQLRTIDSFLLIDEADNIMRYEFDVLRKVLLQGREFGVGVVLASQFLRHFKAGATDYREPLLTWFLHKVPNVTPQELGALGLTTDLAQLAERIKTLEKHQCLFKSQGIPGEVVKAVPFYEFVAKRGRG